MSEKILTSQEKKLKNLRRILWSIFGGIIAVTLLCASLSIPAFLILERRGNLLSPVLPPGMLLFSLAVGVILVIACVSLVCLAVFWLFKKRIEKEEGLFL